MNKVTGLQQNIHQFVLLVFVNGFVGAMIGLERTLLPLLAEQKFGVATATALLSFIAAFGAAKALANYFTGRLSNRLGRKNLLVLGWLLAIPVPFLLFLAPNWSWVVAANVLLGVHQGLSWSSTVIMKIDLVGERQRGFAMGLNEFAGYVSVALTAFATAWLAETWAALNIIFYGGLVLSIGGLLLSVIWVKDTRQHVAAEAAESCRTPLQSVFGDTTWRNPNLFAVTQAGLVNNLNDAMVWGLLPLWMQHRGFSLGQIGFALGLYPLVWGISQIVTGRWSDTMSKKQLLMGGMLVQSVGILGYLLAVEWGHFILCSILLGLGTALVYPVFLATVADNTRPEQRAESIGVFRLWRDLGYVAGALLAGLLSDGWGTETSIGVIGGITGCSAYLIYRNLRDLKPCAGGVVASTNLH